MIWMELALVSAGGALGAVSRHLMGSWILKYTAEQKFPLGTMTVNILGCLAAGLLLGLTEGHKIITSEMRMFLFVGFLGGFTTFSAFGLDTILLIRRGEWMVAGGYVLGSVLVGFLALVVGLKLSISQLS